MSHRFAILRQAMQSALQWRLLLLWILIGLIPTALLALPVSALVAMRMDHSVHAAEWASAVDVVMFMDLMSQFRKAGAALLGPEIAAVVAMLASIPFLNAMFAGASRSDKPLRLGQLMHAGLADYGPMLRLMLMALVPLGIAGGLSALLMKSVHKYAERAILESDVDAVRWAAAALTALLFVYAHAGVTAARAQLAFDANKRSAVKAWWRGTKLVFFHPLSSIGPYIVITLLASAALAVLSLLRVELHTGSVVGFLTGLLLVQAIAAVVGWMHYARLFALLGLTRARASPT